MQFVSNPSISLKINEMKKRVCWQHPLISGQNINQTQVVLENGESNRQDFSFLVIGDSGTGQHRGDSPQRRMMELLLKHGEGSSFALHTGDVVYLVGSDEQYSENFIDPYREWLVGGHQPQDIAYDQMVFQFPFFPVPGNHDYYDLPWIWGLMSQVTLPLRKLFQRQFDLDVGWHGSHKGEVYAKAFLDYVQGLSDSELRQHLDTHYTSCSESEKCLRYQPGQFTRLPNRYYQFSQGGIDFFALDSNTFNAPQALPDTEAGQRLKQYLLKTRQSLMQQKTDALRAAVDIDDLEIEDTYSKVEQIEEQILDIDKQLANETEAAVDIEQLTWLKQQLIQSWQDPSARGRILFFHHPPYVTEATKWYQGQTLAVRQNLRWVLNGVQRQVGELSQGRSIVDLVINGHAHCMEYLMTGDTGHADANLNWVICGGSGFSLRRQRSEGPELTEKQEGEKRIVARSHLYIGRYGHGSQKHRPYSGLRIDVKAGTPPKIILQPLVTERFQHQWQTPVMDTIELK
ncbi:metallophosphoesterase [Acaryochloris sp. IP29b_bin.148]|uniref:metallophosphoesterase family protein n=1 Tax=Acaryochloris sp. IP29b_bin.148 TaxID=2969218 RepID=UPI00260CE439|nr:metallophosphoesterase [Acaryochloris sp. IP29b_bin.148]